MTDYPKRTSTLRTARRCAYVLLAGQLWPSSANAQVHNPRLELHWNAPGAGCPAAATVRERAEQLAGPGGSEGDPVEAVATVFALGDNHFTLRLQLTTENQTAPRELELPSCEEAARAVALIVALALNPRLSQNPSVGALADVLPPRRPSPSGDTALQGSAGLSAPRPRHDPLWSGDRPSSASQGTRLLAIHASGAANLRMTISLGASPVLTTGLIASPSPGIALWQTARRGPLSLELQELIIPHGSVVSDFAANAGGRFSVGGGLLRGCGWLVPKGIVQFGACAIAAAGGLWGHGYGTDRFHTALRGWLGVGAGIAVAWNLSRRVFAIADLAVIGSLLRPGFELDGHALHRPAPVINGLGIGLGVRILE